MILLFRSMFRHLKEHLLQTFFTMMVTILITGMLAVLFLFASSFQRSLRAYALEKNGTYHYKYATNAGTEVERLFEEMADRFGKDGWFSDVQLVREDRQVYLILTVASPDFCTSRTMDQKFNEVKQECFDTEKGEIFYLMTEHNYELLAASGDLSKENGIYSFLLVFFVLLAMVAAAAVLTLGALFKMSAMQREREIALLSGIGADRGQIICMVLMESAIYCLISVPASFLIGIIVYKSTQGYFDNVIYSLFRFPPADLVISIPYSVAQAVCTICVIMFCGLQSAAKISRISPMEALKRTKEIYVKRKESMRNKKGNLYDIKKVFRVESWLANKSCQRFHRRNRPILIMLAVTFSLCFVLDGISTYAMETVMMNFDMISYNYAVDLFSDDRKELDELGDILTEAADGQLSKIREAVFNLHTPYPFLESGDFTLSANGGRLPDVALLCIGERDFEQICEMAGVSYDQDGLWGILLDTERTWWSNGIKMKGRPFHMETGDKLLIYGLSESEEEEEFVLSIAGTSDFQIPYTEETVNTRMQILVPENVFSLLEERRPFRGSEPGAYHLSLRGNLSDGREFEKITDAQKEKFQGITCYTADYEQQIYQEKAGINSFHFLCRALIAVFVLICICGNFTISWSAGKAREREFATFLSVGMTQENLRRMRLLELFHNVLYAFWPGVFAGVCAYQIIFLIYSSEYQISWKFPLAGFLLGTATLVISLVTSDQALRLGIGKKSLSEQLRMEE